MQNTEVLEAAAAKIPASTKVRFHAFRVTNSSGDAINPAPVQKSNNLQTCKNKVEAWSAHGVRCIVIDAETGLQI